ncbi:hypothetical protein LCGC14_2609540 [marine sediment metagenome]|uniref:Uncharacterized protein n=1 Tax=marine sediment metagenome TaxID=412755 RepID=A0A0F9ATW9_9ZZZZ
MAETEGIMKGDQPTTKQKATIAKVATWIDTSVIAMVIAEELVDSEIEVTLETCQKVWQAILEDLHKQIEIVIQYCDIS